MQDERIRLLLQQEVLQAELQVAVDSYTPRAIIGTGGTSEDWAEEGPQQKRNLWSPASRRILQN